MLYSKYTNKVTGQEVAIKMAMGANYLVCFSSSGRKNQTLKAFLEENDPILDSGPGEFLNESTCEHANCAAYYEHPEKRCWEKFEVPHQMLAAGWQLVLKAYPAPRTDIWCAFAYCPEHVLVPR